MTKNFHGAGLSDVPLPKSQLKSSLYPARILSIMSGSEGSGGIAVLSDVIPDSIIADAASRIDQDEVQAVLSAHSVDQENRVYLVKSRGALDLIYDSFKVSRDHNQQLLYELT